MKLRDNFPYTKKQAEKLGVEIRDAVGVFKVFKIDDPSSLAALEKTINEVNRFLEKNGYESISAIDFIKNDFDYESENRIVSLGADGYENSLVLDIETEEYPGLDNESIQFLKEFFNQLKIKTVGYEPARYLDDTILDVEKLPKRLKNAICISFEYNDSNFSIVLNDFKTELNCYTSTYDIDRDGNKRNFESYQSHNYYFGFDGITEVEGSLDEFRAEILSALENVKVTEISISDEE